MSRRDQEQGFGDKAFNVFNILLMIVVAAATVYPFLNVAAISLNDSIDTMRGGIYLWPRVFSLNSYMEIFKNEALLTATRTSVLRTVIGSLLSVFCTAMVAYTFSRKDFVARRLFSFLFVLTMYVGGGMIPVYLMIRQVIGFNNFLVYIIPSLTSAYYIFVVRTYIEGLPISLQESAKMDGANDSLIFFRIILPLCKPVLATILLFFAVGQWNSWFDTLLYCSENKQLTTLQYELMKVLLLVTSETYRFSQSGPGSQPPKASPESVRMAITIVVTLPILFAYPFLQKYFVKGVIIGAVKA